MQICAPQITPQYGWYEFKLSPITASHLPVPVCALGWLESAGTAQTVHAVIRVRIYDTDLSRTRVPTHVESVLSTKHFEKIKGDRDQALTHQCSRMSQHLRTLSVVHRPLSSAVQRVVSSNGANGNAALHKPPVTDCCFFQLACKGVQQGIPTMPYLVATSTSIPRATHVIYMLVRLRSKKIPHRAVPASD